MTHRLRFKPQMLLLWLAILSVAILTACAPVQAQDDPATTATPRATIEFSGDISAVTDTTITVNSLTILTVSAEIETDLVVGNRAHVEGILLENGQIQALEIEDDDDRDNDDDQSPDMTPEATTEITPEATQDFDDDDRNDDDDTLIVIEGPVQSININVIVIYGFEIEVDEDALALTVLQIGDVIRVEGQYDDDDDNNNRIRLVRVNITFVSVIVVIIDGQVWRDAGTCAGIPDWIPDDDIQVILIRCQGGGSRPNNPANNGGGRRGGGDDDDDDGDDDD